MITVDLSRWPLVVTTLRGALTDDDVDELIRESQLVLDRHEVHASIFDGSSLKTVPTATMRKRLGDFTAQTANDRSAVAVAIVIANPIFRGVVTAIHWFGKPTVPTRLFATLDEAERWCIDELAKRGRSVRSRIAR